MPYRLRKSPKRDLYWVIGEDGTHHSKEPIPKERAEAQMKALYIAMRQKRGGVKHPKRFRYSDSDSGSSSESDFDMDTAEKNAAHTLAEMKRTGVEPPPKRRYRGSEQQLSPDTLDMLGAMKLPHTVRSPPLLNAFSHKVHDSPGATGRRPTQSREPPPPAGRRHRFIDAYEESSKEESSEEESSEEESSDEEHPSGSGYGGVSIPKSEFIKEHERLIQLLQTGSPAQRKREAKSQAKELAMKRGGYNSYIDHVNRCMGGSNDPTKQTAEMDAIGRDPSEEYSPTELQIVENSGLSEEDFLQDDDIKMEPEFEKLPNSNKYGPYNDAFLLRIIKLAQGYINDKTVRLSPAEKREQYQNIGQAKAFMKQRDALEKKLLRERARDAASLKEAFGSKLKSKFVAPVYKTTEEMGLGRGYGRMRGCGKEEDAARLISMFEEMKRKLEEARQPEPEPAVPDEDEETALVPDTSVHRPSSPGYDVIGRMMKPNEDGEAKKALKVSDKSKADAKAFAEQLRSAGLEERDRQNLPLRLMALDTKDILLRGILMPQKGSEVKQEDIDKKINLLRRQVFEVGDPRQGLYEYRLEELIPELKYERTLSGREVKDLILSTAEELERARRQEFPDYISSAKYKGFSGRGKSPYETPDVAKMMADARTRRKEMADERQRVRELEATMENWGFFVKVAMKNNMTPIYLAHLIVNKPDRFTEKMINRAKYVLRLSGYGYHGGSKEDWVVLLNKHIADLKKETGSNKSKLEYYSTLKGLSDKMSYPQFDVMSKWLDEWQSKNKGADGYYNLDSLMSRLKDFWNSPLAGTFAVKPVTSPIKRMSEISQEIPENLKAWIEIKLKEKAEKNMRYMTPAEREADMARAMAFTDRAIVELNEATEAAKLRRENPEEANRREAEAKAKASAEQAARLRQFQLDTKRRIAERHQRFRPAGYL